MKKAIVVCIEDKKHLLLQTMCLYNSLKHINSPDTSLVVLGTKPALNKLPNDCIKVEYKPITYDKKWHGHHFVNSISGIAENKEIFNDFDIIVKTDADTFVTPSWNNFNPPNYTVGLGYFVNSQEVKDKILKVASDMGLNHRGIFSVGTTHFGLTKDVIEVCRLGMDVTLNILNNYFPDGEGKWPYWYKWVSLLYGCEIAANHLIKDLTVDRTQLDYQSTGDESVDKHPHIHCYHTSNMFSKFEFEHGKYDHMDCSKLDLNKVNNYCLKIALEAKKIKI